MEVENLASREMDTTYLSLVEVVVFKAWVKEKWEEREVERLTRQRPTAQRSDSLYNLLTHNTYSRGISDWYKSFTGGNMVLLHPALLCHKDTAQATQSWFFMA